MATLNCPGCSSSMQQLREPDLTIDVCPNCGGRFLDRGELNALATGLSGDIEFCSAAYDLSDHEDRFPPRICPKCSEQVMEKVDLLGFSDLIFDFCPSCEGFYFDAREIDAMNKELRKISESGTGEEYRTYHDEHLVRVDRLSKVAWGAGLGGAAPVDAWYFQVVVYYKAPLNTRMRISKERWTTKLAKVFGVFRAQDIQIGDEAFDRAFVIQGEDEIKVRSKLSAMIRSEILGFVANPPKLLHVPGKLEILDDRLVYTEGPYKGKVEIDWRETPNKVIAALARLAKHLEAD